MVNRKFKSSIVTRRRSFPPDYKKGRPKRNVSPKVLLEDTVTGISWKEERELKKALYASLQESRRSSRDERPEGDEEQSCDSMDSAAPDSLDSAAQSPVGLIGLLDESSNSQDAMPLPVRPKPDTAKNKFHAQRKYAQNSMPMLHSETPPGSFQKKVHAQRKFAQGSHPSTPSETPSKPRFKASPVRLFPVRPKTEDFLTYLCFRGTNLLPPHLDLLNVTQYTENIEPSTPSNNGRPGHTRESSPASSSTISHTNEDSVDIPDLTPRSQTPNRKAARASASTPETARGFLRYPSSNGRHSGTKASPLSRDKVSQDVSSRTRYGDRFSPASRVLKMPRKESPIKLRTTAADRLALKRKAMATLTAAKKTDKSHRSGKMFKKALSEGEMMKRKANLRDRHPITMQRIEKGHSPSRSSHSPSRSNQSKKRKSSSDLSHDSPPSPVKRMRKLRSSERVRKMLKAQAKTNSEKPVSKKYYSEFYETHPVKKLGTSVRPKPVKHKGPVTRASSHLKSMLTSAKLAATRKLRMLKRAHQTPRRDQRSLTRAVDRRSWSSGTPKSSPDSSYSKSSGSPSPRTGLNGSPKQNGTSKQSPSPTKSEPFPKDREKANIVQCPTFHPTDEQFKDPLEYIQSISAKAEPYGICKIVPPPSWKMESRVIDDLRFTCQNQHIHQMLHRWGPNADRMEAIKRHFESTGTEKFQFPQIGGVEVDLVKLYDVVQRYGGMKRILDKKKWMKVADAMKIPKQAQDRITKLYSVYCKFLLSFETLSDEEQHKIEHSVQMDRQKQEKQRTHSNSATDKCVEKGRAQPFSAFNRAARNTLAMFGREDSESCAQIESDYWDYVESGEDHVCVQSATLDTSIYGSMFPVRRDNPYSRHPWNLHNFIQSKGCVLEHLGLIADVTVPTLRFGMLYTTTCLACNSHNLPTVQYLHQGADIIWYAVPRQKTGQLKKALKEIVPSHVRDKGFILEKDSVMVPPDSLVEHGVPMTRCVQSSREFVVVFSGAYHCNISCGYTLSESVHYASMSWIPLGYHAAKDLSANHDAELFSMDAMLVFLARDISTNEETLSLLLPHLKQVVDRELSERQALHEAGLKERQKLPNRSARLSPKSEVLEEIVICDVSRKICYLSMVLNESENSAFSLEQGLIHLKKKKKDIPNCKLMYRYSEEELKALVKDVKERIHKSEQQHSSSSSPTRMTLRKSTEKSSPINLSR